ncbi:MAG: penicillin acylase family protein [Cyclobacteriaceae bacterium]
MLLALLMFSTAGVSQINPDNIVIARDTFGVPHIFAPTDAEAAYGLAWAHSEDDFRNIQLSMLAAQGMLGRVEGLDGALFDFGLQFLSIDSLVDARYESDLSPQFREVIEGFVQGLNDFSKKYPKQIIRKKAFPIEPKDVIKGYVLNTALMAGLGMALKAVTEDRIHEFYSVNDAGSNAMAVSPNRMNDGKGYLLVNAHRPIEGRFAWYEAHISSEEDWEIIGGLFPGGMSIFVGANKFLGWTHTTNYHNFGDIYKLEINPNNRNQYRYDGEWKTFYEKKAKLVVKIAGIPLPIKRKIQICTYGPVLKTKHGSYAFRFPGYMDIRAAEQWFKMNKATDFKAFEAAIKMQAIPLFNIVYADVGGNIMLHSGGKVPQRDPKLNWTFPITANTSEYRWKHILPYEKMPQILNPACGFVFNSNNTPLISTGDSCNWDNRFPGLQLFMYNRGDQYSRFMNAVEGSFTERVLSQIKFNTQYSNEGTYMDHFKNMYQLDENKYPNIADAIVKIKKWDLGGDAVNRDAALGMVTHDFLRQKLNGPFALLMIRQETVTEADAVWAISQAKKLLLRTHGSLDVPLGQVQRLIRGNKSFPANGLREVSRAADTELDNKKKGIFKVVGGDGYIQIVRFSKNGTEIKSINAYGSSSNPDSPHYTDQMEMFTSHQFKDMTFNKAQIFRSAEKIYHPNGGLINVEEALDK